MKQAGGGGSTFAGVFKIPSLNLACAPFFVLLPSVFQLQDRPDITWAEPRDESSYEEKEVALGEWVLP